MNKENKKKDKVKQDKNEILVQEAQANLAGWKRAKADYENLKKRTEEEKLKLLKYANEDMVLNLLPVIDNFESAYRNIPQEIESNSWVQGIGFIKDQFDKFLEDNDIKKIKSKGEQFDPSIHEAIESVKSEMKQGIVIEEVLKGYKYKDKVIRPAKVKVAK